MKTVRFYEYINETFVKLSIKQGQKLEFSTGGKCDEGFDVTYFTYKFDGEMLTLDVFNDARDCDGRFQSGQELCANVKTDLKLGNIDVSELSRQVSWDQSNWENQKSVEIGTLINWKKVDNYQRDFEAERCGY